MHLYRAGLEGLQRDLLLVGDKTLHMHALGSTSGTRFLCEYVHTCGPQAVAIHVGK